MENLSKKTYKNLPIAKKPRPKFPAKQRDPVKEKARRREMMQHIDFHIKRYHASARKRGLEITISKDEFALFWKKPCSYCGDSIEFIGLDRIDSSKGYIIENVTPCCQACNKAKLCMTHNEFINHCVKIVNHFNRGGDA